MIYYTAISLCPLLLGSCAPSPGGHEGQLPFHLGMPPLDVLDGRAGTNPQV